MHARHAPAPALIYHLTLVAKRTPCCLMSTRRLARLQVLQAQHQLAVRAQGQARVLQAQCQQRQRAAQLPRIQAPQHALQRRARSALQRQVQVQHIPVADTGRRLNPKHMTLDCTRHSLAAARACQTPHLQPTVLFKRYNLCSCYALAPRHASSSSCAHKYTGTWSAHRRRPPQAALPCCRAGRSSRRASTITSTAPAAPFACACESAPSDAPRLASSHRGLPQSQDCLSDCDHMCWPCQSRCLAINWSAVLSC